MIVCSQHISILGPKRWFSIVCDVGTKIVLILTMSNAFDSLLHRFFYSNVEINGKTNENDCVEMGFQNHIKIDGRSVPIKNLLLRMLVYTHTHCTQVQSRSKVQYSILMGINT